MVRLPRPCWRAATFVIGIIYNPITEELYAARQGKGATLNGKPDQSQQDVRSLDEARLGIGFSYRQPVARTCARPSEPARCALRI